MVNPRNDAEKSPVVSDFARARPRGEVGGLVGPGWVAAGCGGGRGALVGVRWRAAG
jgi:hypothetical protein